ncbi:MAG: cobalamin B12-binding domain-containing protein [Candidatus Wallbacteria bacterium]|nr:cobalamin B12-binding domain-containing protein [Candidatus Wallbacteria bacterium]
MPIDAPETKTDLYIVTVPFWGVRMPPLGAAYVAAAANAAGFRTRLTDLNVECFDAVRGDKDLERLWDNNPPDVTAAEACDRVFRTTLPIIDRWIDELLASGAHSVGFSLNYRNLDFGNRLARRIKERAPGLRLIFGGPESFAQHKLGYLHKNEADIFVIGEGEHTLVELLRALVAGQPLDGLPGVVFRKEGIIMSAYTPRKPEMKLDRLPFPTYEGLPLAKYSTRRLPMLMSRGCVCHCRFCVDYILNAPYRFRGAQAVVEEMKFQLRTNGSGEFAFNDLLCNGNMKQLEQLCDMIIASELPVVWDSYAIVRKEMTPAILAKMRRAGCLNLCYGTESGSDRVLKLMGKFSPASVSAQNIKDTHEAGIRTSINIIVGYPGETQDDFEQTLAFLDHSAPWIDEVTNVSSLVVMPGTYIAENQKEFGIQYIDNADSWVDEAGSTPETRGDRVARLLERISAHGLGKEIVNHDYHTAGNIMISVVVPFDGTGFDARQYRLITGYPFQVVLAGDGVTAFADGPRLKVAERKPGETLAQCVNAALELTDGRYVALVPPNMPPSRELLFTMYRAMERAPDVHFALPRQAAASCVFLRKTAFRELGGLDPGFGPETWTTDLLMRAQLWGYASASVLEARALAPAGPLSAAPALAARNALELVLKNYPRVFLKKEALHVVMRLLERMLPSRQEPLSPLHHLAGYARALADFPRTLAERRRILCQMTVPDHEAGRFLKALEGL